MTDASFVSWDSERFGDIGGSPFILSYLLYHTH